jgi:ribosome-associated translation inhibitor RaiA
MRNMEGSMLKIVFKNMESSQLVKDIVHERISPIIEKFPSLEGHNITLTLEMENSPKQAGPDLFTVSSVVRGKTYKGLKIKRSSGNFYHATAELADGLNQLLGRESDRLIKSSKRKKIPSEEIFL